MHGLSPGLSLPVNAEIKPMGGVVDCGLGVDSKTSPRRAAIEKAQADLQQEFGIREERKKELEFLEKLQSVYNLLLLQIKLLSHMLPVKLKVALPWLLHHMESQLKAVGDLVVLSVVSLTSETIYYS